MTIRQKGKIFHQLRRDVLLRDGGGLTDAELLECFLSDQDEAAFEALVRRHGPMVWGVCRRLLPCHHDAEDAFQATFVVLVRKAAAIASRELLANWLYGVAQRTALRAKSASLKRQAREKQVADMPEPEVWQGESWGDLQPLLDRELSGLPDKYRVPILLCDLEGRTRKDVARQLGCPEGTVAGRLARARTMLARRLARRGVALSLGALVVVLSPKVASGGVPGSVITSTVKAAGLLAAGPAAAGGLLAAPVAALSEGVLQSMLFHKIKIGLMLLLTLAAVGGGGVAYLQLQAADPQQKQDTKRSPLPGGKEIAPGAGQALANPEGEKKEALFKQALEAEKREALFKQALTRQELDGYKVREVAARQDQEALRKELAVQREKILLQEIQNVKLKAQLESVQEGLMEWKDKYRLKDQENLKLRDELARLVAQTRKPLPSPPQGKEQTTAEIKPPARTEIKPPAQRVQGVVQEVTSEGLVKISLGSDQGIQEGQSLQVYRLRPNPEYLGTLKILVVLPAVAIGKAKDHAGKKIEQNDLVTNLFLELSLVDGQNMQHQQALNEDLRVQLAKTRRDLAVLQQKYFARELEIKNLKNSLQSKFPSGKGHAAGKEKPLPPAVVQGEVTQITPEGYVKISLGSAQGMREGQNVYVTRPGPVPEYCGAVQLLVVFPNESIGKSPSRNIQPKDSVSTIEPSGS